MPNYVKKNLQQFNFTMSATPHHSPHPHNKPIYSSKPQMAEEDTSPKLTKEQITLLQQIIGVFLYYARAIDSTILVTLSDLAAQQTQATELTMQKANQLRQSLKMGRLSDLF